MLQVSVQNGTRAGHRVVRMTHDWNCPTCGARLRYYWKKCPNDGHPRV